MNILDKTRACQQCRARKPCRLFDYGDGIREWLCYGEDSCYEWAESAPYWRWQHLPLPPRTED